MQPGTSTPTPITTVGAVATRRTREPRLVRTYLRWQAQRKITQLDTIYAHSHGGNVALDHVASGERVAMLVLMHTPFLPRSERDWTEIERNAGRIVVLRTRADLVVLLNNIKNGSTALPPAGLTNVRDLPSHPFGVDFWLRHSFFTRLRSWQTYGIANEVRFERQMTF